MSAGREASAFFIPGAAGQALFWHPLARRLPESWSKRAVDLPGFGPIAPDPVVRSYDQLLAWLAEMVERPSVVLGQSMGAYLALRLALEHPSKVTHLVLSVAAAGVDMPAHGARDWRPRHRDAHSPASDWIYDPPVDLTESLARIEVPVLLVWATRDPLSPLSVAATLERELARAELMTFDTDDHWVVRRHAQTIASRVASLVAEGSGVRAPVP